MFRRKREFRREKTRKSINEPINKPIRKAKNSEKNHKKQFKKQPPTNVVPLMIYLLLFLWFGIGFISMFLGYAPMGREFRSIGYVSLTKEFNYVDNVSLEVYSSDNYTWVMDSYGELKSIRISGSIGEEGYAKVHLVHEGDYYLIFDSRRLGEGIGGITGLVVGNETSDEYVEEVISEGEKEIKVALDGGGSKDMDDMFEFSVSSDFNWDVSYDKICTRWDINSINVCYGSGECCALIGLESLGEWDDSFYLSYGRYNAREDNIIKAQVIYADYSLNIDNPYADVVYSDVSGVRAEFYEPVIRFENICIASCLLDDLNESKYTLRFTIENATLKVDTISYSIMNSVNISRNAPALVKSFENITLYKNRDNIIDLSEYFYDRDELVYYAYETDNISIVIRNSSAKIVPSFNFTGKRFIYFTASDGYYNVSSNLFEVRVIDKPFTVSEVNVSESLVKPRVVINKPVRWVKFVNVSGAVINLSVNISSDALNVSVIEIRENRTISEDKLKVNDRGVVKDAAVYRAEKRISQIEKVKDKLTQKKAEIISADPTAVREVSSINRELLELVNEKNKLTGYVVAAKGKGLWGRFFGLLFKITGYAVYEEAWNESNITFVIIEDIVSNIEVEYYTEGPVSEEENISSGKRIIVSSDIHYEDIEAYTYVEDVSQKNIKLYWIVNGSRQVVNSVSYFDEDSNGLIDLIEWIIPSLSNQTYELIIEITKAEHLDVNRSFISDVYDYVKVKDDNFTLIPSGDYVRVTFEVPLDNTRDITLYARSDSSASIEVYTENSSELVTSFSNVSNEDWYKVYLTSLNGTHDVFDLRVNGSVEFDYIVDPYPAGSINVSECMHLNQSGGYYTLNNSINVGAGILNCIIINNDSLTFDLNGFSIVGDGGSADFGIKNSGFDDISIKNGEIHNFSIGIYNSGGTYSNFTNLTIKSSFGSSDLVTGIYLAMGGGHIVSDSNISITNNGAGKVYGIYATRSSNTIINNNIYSNVGGGDGFGIYVNPSGSNVIQNNTMNSNMVAIYLGSSSNSLINNSIWNCTISCLTFDGSSNNKVIGGVINLSAGHLINIISQSDDNNFTDIILGNATNNTVFLESSNNNRFENLTISDSTLVAFNINSSNSTTLINNTITNSPFDYMVYDSTINQYSFINNSLEIENANGIVKFLNTSLIVSGNNLSKVISISNNSVFVNTSLDKGFNTTANVTLYSISNITEPKVIGDFDDDGIFEECSDCVNLSWDGSTFVFNVSHFTSYKASDVTDLYDCGTLNRTNAVYNLQNDVTTSGTCFTISANNVTLNLSDYGITGSGSGSGVTIINYNYSTIRDGSISNFASAISLSNSDNNLISGINITDISYNGISITSSSDNNIITDSRINASQNGIQLGIFLGEGVFNNTVKNSYFSNNQYDGIWIYGSDNNKLINNTFESNPNGIWLSSSHNNTLENNTYLNCKDPSFGCISFDGGSKNNSIKGEFMNGSAGYLIILGTNSNNNIFSNLNLHNSTKNAIYLSGVKNNYLTNINISNSTLSAVKIVSSSEVSLINITTTSSLRSFYLDRTNVSEYSFVNNSLLIENLNGKIEFLNTSLNANGNNLSKVISLTSNSVFVNTSLDSGFNTSANITLGNLDFGLPKIEVDSADNGVWEDCILPTCRHLSYISGALVFNATHFSTYRANESVIGKPQINSTTVVPTIGDIGTVFNIIVDVVYDVTIDKVIAYIQKPDENNTDTITLSLNNGLYNGTWNSSGKAEGTYLIDIKVNDTFGNESEKDNDAVIGLSSAAEDTFTNSSVNVTSNAPVIINATETTDTWLNITSNVNTTASVSIVLYSDNIESVEATGVTELGKYVSIIVDNDTNNNISSAEIRVYYTDAEVSAANLVESTLRLYKFNESSNLWYLLPGGVDTTLNYVWGNVSSFSFFGVFGAVVSAEEAAEAAEAAVARGAKCIPHWNCTDWGECLPEGIQKRKCSLIGTCFIRDNEPENERSCDFTIPKPKETCFDNVKNQNEESIDCGGVCKPCERFAPLEKTVSSRMLMIAWIVVLFVIITLRVIMIMRKKNER